jgi:aminopeptidase N
LQPVTTAEQALQAFDSITYDKGAAVITMLEAYVGPDRFREGVRRYMKAHAFGNTVDNDLWREVQAAAGEPVVDIEHDFTRQAGVPLIRVIPEGGQVRLEESRFAEDPDSVKDLRPQTWRIPLTVAPARGAPVHLLLSGTATVAGPAPLVNAGGLAYARVAYPQAHATALAERMAGFSPMDQINLMNDAWALGQSGYAPASNVMAFIRRLPTDADPVVWSRAVGLLTDIDTAYPDGPARTAFRREALDILAPLARRLGQTSAAGEAANQTSLRASVWRAQAVFGDPEALTRARKIYASGEGAVADQRTALDIVAQSADAATFEALLAKAKQTRDPQIKAHIFEAMARAADPALSRRMVEIALGPDVPAGTPPRLLGEAGAANPDATWAALAPHLSGKLPIDEQEAWLVVAAIASGSADPARIADIRAYGAAHVPADARRPIESAVGSIKLNERVRAKALPDIDRWVAAQS